MIAVRRFGHADISDARTTVRLLAVVARAVDGRRIDGDESSATTRRRARGANQDSSRAARDDDGRTNEATSRATL